ncbi:hypothetical protein Sbs19_40510 [Sphingobium sp. BS19]|nr:hypothetical protein Sbs19_40510 [Sphingobium sp. BS19]
MRILIPAQRLAAGKEQQRGKHQTGKAGHEEDRSPFEMHKDPSAQDKDDELAGWCASIIDIDRGIALMQREAVRDQ